MLDNNSKSCAGPGYASPKDAIKAPREKVVYTICIYTGTGIEKPDYLATIDVDENSSTYGEIIHRTELGVVGDELHHMGWNACSSCNTDGSMERKYLIIPGVRTSNFYIVDTATDPRKPALFKTVSGDEIKEKNKFVCTTYCPLPWCRYNSVNARRCRRQCARRVFTIRQRFQHCRALGA